MPFSKISSIVFFVVVGITIPIMGLFYFGENLVNTEQYEAKVQKIENILQKSSPLSFVEDLQSAGSNALKADSTANLNGNNITQNPAPVIPDKVIFNFMEKLVYYKMDIAIVWGYVLLIISILIALVFPVIYAIAHPVNMIRILLVLIGILALVGVSYLLSSDKPLEIIGYSGTDNSDPTVLKLIDTGLIINYFVLGFAFLAILYSEIAKYFK
jgi:uncharacterized membrane protein YgaE (UPF0421/DUF939 family)